MGKKILVKSNLQASGLIRIALRASDILMDRVWVYVERGQGGSAISFSGQADTAELTTWILMPRRREYRNFRISRHATGNPEKTEAVRLVTDYLAVDFAILAFKLLPLKPGWTYVVTWVYK